MEVGHMKVVKRVLFFALASTCIFLGCITAPAQQTHGNPTLRPDAWVAAIHDRGRLVVLSNNWVFEIVEAERAEAAYWRPHVGIVILERAGWYKLLNLESGNAVTASFKGELRQ
jgi:hypothetical protein